MFKYGTYFKGSRPHFQLLLAAEDEGKTLRKCYCLNVSKSETKNVINIYFIYIYEFHRLKKFPNQLNHIFHISHFHIDSRDMVENGAPALETCPIFKQVSDVYNV